MGFKRFVLKRITIGSYSKLTGRQRALVDYTIENGLKENHRLRKGFRRLEPKETDFWNLSWSDMILTWRYLEEKNIFELLKLHYPKLKEKDFTKLDIFNAMACYKWIAGRTQIINNAMKNELHQEPTSEEKGAGIDNFSRFDYLPTLKQLCNNDRTQYDFMLAKKFSFIFREMALIKEEINFNRNYRNIVSRKSKRNV